MIINSRELIAGLPSLKVRKFLKHVKEFDSFGEWHVTRYLGLPMIEAKGFLQKLSTLGFTKRLKSKKGEPPRWEVTSKGMTLSQASARPLKKQLAETKVDQFLKRVSIVNADPSYLYSVTLVIIFGSYLSEKKVIGDIDIAIELKAKEKDPAISNLLREKKMKEAKLAGKQFSSWMKGLSWPHHEVWKFLKSRSRGLNLHSYEIHEEMLKSAPHQVVFREPA